MSYRFINSSRGTACGSSSPANSYRVTPMLARFYPQPLIFQYFTGSRQIKRTVTAIKLKDLAEKSEKNVLRDSLPGWRHIRILINTTAGFAAQAASLYVLHQQWRGPVLVSERFVKVFEDAETRVEADEIDQFKRSHRMIETKLQRLINVGGRGDSLLQHVERFIADHGVDAAGDEARRFLDHHN